ncbi:MAG: hypothetical protein Q4G67_02105 [Actinomycetia bacterium]|nr:hypothetical protein [Actinomycetes bacterium]
MGPSAASLLSQVHDEGAGPLDVSGLCVLVTGAGVGGFAAADALAERGAEVILIDADSERDSTAEHDARAERLRLLEVLGVEVRTGAQWVSDLPSEPIDLVVTSPPWRPDEPVLAQAASRQIPIWGEAELAWRLRPAGAPPWLTLCGVPRARQAARLAAAMLRAGGLAADHVGLPATPVIETVLNRARFDVVVAELSSQELHWSSSISPLASVCLAASTADSAGVAWHGSVADYHGALGTVYERTQIACVYSVEDTLSEALVREADVIEGARAIGCTLGTPAPSMLGVVDDVLADRAFVPERQHSAAELATIADVLALGPAAAQQLPDLVVAVLSAAALARAAGVAPAAVRAGLQSLAGTLS